LEKLASLWKSLITNNPMMAEVGRFRKRYLTFSGPTTTINGGLGLILILYGVFAISCVYNRGDTEPIGLLHIFLVFSLFTIPLLLHATIAGERERRSWDMLLVAPITPAQIIVGKFVAATLGVSTAFGIFMIPVVIDAIYYEQTNWVSLFFGSIIVLLQVASVTALTILVSSRVKRPLTALGVVLATVMIYFMFAPIVIGNFSGFLGTTMITALSPFGMIVSLSNYGRNEPDYSNYVGINPYFIVTVNIVFEIFLTAVLLIWAIKTLVYADNEVKFLPKNKKHA
jgi:ABC-type Na+ efflux pump permease subunit